MRFTETSEIEAVLLRAATDATDAHPDSKAMERFRRIVALLTPVSPASFTHRAEVILDPDRPILCPSCKGGKREDPSRPLELSVCQTCDGLRAFATWCAVDRQPSWSNSPPRSPGAYWLVMGDEQIPRLVHYQTWQLPNLADDGDAWWLPAELPDLPEVA